MVKSIPIVSRSTLRRFILGKQGLWPGRRWKAKTGTAQAIKAIEAIQIDPVSVVAQSHDIVLWGRVHDYSPEFLKSLLYEERNFFDYGGNVNIYPMEELPYWRVFMERRKSEKRWADFATANPDLLAEVRKAIRDQGPLRNRDLDGQKIEHYRGSKDTNVALYYLWLTGELMTHHRDGKERVYDFLENVAPSDLQFTATEKEAINFVMRKKISQLGVIDLRRFRVLWQALNNVRIKLDGVRAIVAQWIKDRQLAQIRIEENDQLVYILSSDLPRIQGLQSKKVPKAWKPIDTTTQEEVVLLSPLEYVSARGRAAKIFDFEYIWEIYKPAAKRQYGPYTMPILYDDTLVARLDSKYDHQNQMLLINGFWPEAWFDVDIDFVNALAKGLSNFRKFLGSDHIDITHLNPKSLREHLKKELAS